MQVYADIVINHNSGGQSEANPYTGTNTWTNFSGVASGKFQRNYNDFYKNAYGNNDEGAFFGGFPDCAMPILMYRTGFGKEMILLQNIIKML
jgi:alpha-amylase